MPRSIIQFRQPRSADHAFTVRDLIELHGFRSGQCRVMIEIGRSGGEPADAGFALIYPGTAPWASWGIARNGDHVTVWNCVSHADVGRFRSMKAALAALPLADRAAPTRSLADILPFRPRLAG